MRSVCIGFPIRAAPPFSVLPAVCVRSRPSGLHHSRCSEAGLHRCVPSIEHAKVWRRVPDAAVRPVVPAMPRYVFCGRGWHRCRCCGFCNTRAEGCVGQSGAGTPCLRLSSASCGPDRRSPCNRR